MMLSRVADSIYWMSRYLERAENVARFIDVNLQLLLDLSIEEQTQWQPLAAVTGDLPWFEKKYGPATRENVVRFLTFDSEYPNSIYSCLTSARENARSIRETISSELWQEINRFYLKVNERGAEDEARARPYRFFEQLRLAGCLCNGMCDFTMSHNESWHFSQIGRLLERADKTSRILDVKYFMLLPKADDVGKPIDIIQWSAVLNSASALEMHRRTYNHLTPANVCEFLLLDRCFPRSIYFCFLKAEESLHAITGSPPGTFANLAEQKLGALRSELAFSRIEDIMRGGLHEYLDRLQGFINATDDSVYETYFRMHPAPKSALIGTAQ